MTTMSTLEDQSPEKLVYAASTHWVKYVSRFLHCNLLGIIAIGLFVAAYSLKESSHDIALFLFFSGSIILLIAHHILFHKLLSEELLDIFVTTKRVLYFNDFLFTCDDEHEIPLKRVTGVQVQQHGIVQNLLNYGILWFDTGGGQLDIKRSIPNVSRPEEIARIISKMLGS